MLIFLYNSALDGHAKYPRYKHGLMTLPKLVLPQNLLELCYYSVAVLDLLATYDAECLTVDISLFLQPRSWFLLGSRPVNN